MKCRLCENKLKDVPQGGFDAFYFLNTIKMMYCENKECAEFGFVVVAGIKEDDEVIRDINNK